VGAYAQSPLLLGADNRQFTGTYHNDLRLDSSIIAEYRGFLEDAEKSAALELRRGGGVFSCLLPTLLLFYAYSRGKCARLKRPQAAPYSTSS
jgi:hypothetical protein